MHFFTKNILNQTYFDCFSINHIKYLRILNIFDIIFKFLLEIIFFYSNIYNENQQPIENLKKTT